MADKNIPNAISLQNLINLNKNYKKITQLFSLQKKINQKDIFFKFDTSTSTIKTQSNPIGLFSLEYKEPEFKALSPKHGISGYISYDQNQFVFHLKFTNLNSEKQMDQIKIKINKNSFSLTTNMHIHMQPIDPGQSLTVHLPLIVSTDNYDENKPKIQAAIKENTIGVVYFETELTPSTFGFNAISNISHTGFSRIPKKLIINNSFELDGNVEKILGKSVLFFGIRCFEKLFLNEFRLKLLNRKSRSVDCDFDFDFDEGVEIEIESNYTLEKGSYFEFHQKLPNVEKLEFELTTEKFGNFSFEMTK